MDLTTLSRSFRVAVVIVLIMLADSVSAISAQTKGCSVHVVRDTYVYPPSEMSGLVAYPDIVVVENEYVELRLLPNRGISIWRYLFKATGNDELYFNANPIPAKDPSGRGPYFAEFGGNYLLFPWNWRDNTPLLASYQILTNTTDIVQVTMSATDIETKMNVEQQVVLRRESPVVEIYSKIVNQNVAEATLQLRDRTVVTVTNNTYFEVPTDKVTIGPSAEGWMGIENSELSWPQPWRQYKNWKAEGSFYAYNPSEASIQIKNIDTGYQFIKSWEPKGLLKSIRIQSWGPYYDTMKFSKPVAYIEFSSENKTLSPGGSIEFRSYLNVARITSATSPTPTLTRTPSPVAERPISSYVIAIIVAVVILAIIGAAYYLEKPKARRKDARSIPSTSVV